MRWKAKVDKYPGWRRRLLLIPMNYEGTWIWLEMVWMMDCGTYTQVVTEKDFKEQRNAK